MAFPPVPQDEQVYDNPSILPGLPGGNLNPDSVLWYFMNSPFFDRQSNNTALLNQLHGRPEGDAILFKRRAFEERLAKFPTGTSYVCVAEPQGPGQPYVLQRQLKRIDPATGRTITEVQATYYTQGTRIFVAPSLLDVLQTRLLTTATKLQDAYQLAKDLNHFAPGTGHSYLSPTYELPKAAAATSRIGSPSLAPPAEPSQTQGRKQTETQTQTQPRRPAAADANLIETPDTFSDTLFMQSLALADSHYLEYADENPLQGEPGAFVYSSTYEAVQQRNQQQEKKRLQKAAQTGAAPAATANPNANVGASGAANANANPNIKTEALASGSPSVAATPAAPEVAPAHSRKGSIAAAPKAKRKKSKGVGTTPVTPTAPHF